MVSRFLPQRHGNRPIRGVYGENPRVPITDLFAGFDTLFLLVSVSLLGGRAELRQTYMLLTVQQNLFTSVSHFHSTRFSALFSSVWFHCRECCRKLPSVSLPINMGFIQSLAVVVASLARIMPRSSPPLLAWLSGKTCVYWGGLGSRRKTQTQIYGFVAIWI